MKYHELHIRNKGEDIITDGQGNKVSTVLDYWKWAHSCLLDNVERGAFAEYLVACAVGGKGEGRVNWEKYDILSEDGITIEVKTSAYLQVWGQEKLSAIRFGIQKTHALIPNSNIYETEKRRQAQVYVFCVYTETDQDKVNLLDTTKWKFYVLASKVLNESKEYENSRSIGLNALIKLGAIESKYEDIHNAVIEQANS